MRNLNITAMHIPAILTLCKIEPMVVKTCSSRNIRKFWWQEFTHKVVRGDGDKSSPRINPDLKVKSSLRKNLEYAAAKSRQHRLNEKQITLEETYLIGYAEVKFRSLHSWQTWLEEMSAVSLIKLFILWFDLKKIPVEY